MIDWWRYADSKSLATSHDCGHEHTGPCFDKEDLLPLSHRIRVRSYGFARCHFNPVGLPHFMPVPGCEAQDITFLVLFWPVPPSCLPRSGTDGPRFFFTSNKQPLFPQLSFLLHILNPSSDSSIDGCLELLWASTSILRALWIDDGVGGVIVVPAE